VSRQAGEAWKNKLFRLPRFLENEGESTPTGDELADAFGLTGFFLQRHVLEPRGIAMPPAREGFVSAIARRQPAPQSGVA
jgi:DNA repair protein RecO (recombination protein O)